MNYKSHVSACRACSPPIPISARSTPSPSPARWWSQCSTATASPTTGAWPHGFAPPASAPSSTSAPASSARRRNTPTAAAARASFIQGTDEKQKGEVQIKDLILGAELAGLSKERDDYLKKQAEAQFAVPEERLVDAVREVLTRHAVRWG